MKILAQYLSKIADSKEYALGHLNFACNYAFVKLEITLAQWS